MNNIEIQCYTTSDKLKLKLKVAKKSEQTSGSEYSFDSLAHEVT